MNIFHKWFCCHAFEYVSTYEEVSLTKADARYSENYKNLNTKKLKNTRRSVFETMHAAE